ncbi:MAG: glycosyltransferase family 61 protein [Marmoricola sp.]
MSRLPPALGTLWPAVKRLHRGATRASGAVARRTAPRWGQRGLPTTAATTSRETAAAEPEEVRLHPAPAVSPIRRTPPEGSPADHWAFRTTATAELPERFTLEIAGGTVLGDYGAVITPGGRLDFETSEYFGIHGWREHPLYLRSRLPPIEDVDGDLLVLATRGGSNYYHVLMDVLPRLVVLRESLPDRTPDRYYVADATGYQRRLLQMAGIPADRVVATRKHRAVRAGRLLVPSLPNPDELAPPWVVQWLRATFPPVRTEGRPRRLYVTRGGGRHTRRLDSEPELWPELERRGFTRIDPGTLDVQEQVDHFAAAEVVVGVHGAALTNLVFARPGARVLELFPPTYVKHCFWAITCGVPDVEYRYLVGRGRVPTEGTHMPGVHADIDLDARRVLSEVDRML